MIKKTVLIILTSLALVACTPQSGAPASQGTSETFGTGETLGKNDMVIQSFTFTPKTLTAQKGQTVNITNNDTVPHTVTSKDKKSFDTGTINPGASAAFTAPEKTGTYAFLCTFHKNMTGTLVVQ